MRGAMFHQNPQALNPIPPPKLRRTSRHQRTQTPILRDPEASSCPSLRGWQLSGYATILEDSWSTRKMQSMIFFYTYSVLGLCLRSHHWRWSSLTSLVQSGKNSSPPTTNPNLQLLQPHLQGNHQLFLAHGTAQQKEMAMDVTSHPAFFQRPIFHISTLITGSLVATSLPKSKYWRFGTRPRRSPAALLPEDHVLPKGLGDFKHNGQGRCGV